MHLARREGEEDLAALGENVPNELLRPGGLATSRWAFDDDDQFFIRRLCNQAVDFSVAKFITLPLSVNKYKLSTCGVRNGRRNHAHKGSILLVLTLLELFRPLFI